MASVTEQSFDATPLRGSTDTEKRNAAISLAEAALKKKRWTEKFRKKQLRIALEALDLIDKKGADDET